MAQAMSTHLGEALGTDFFSVREQFTDERPGQRFVVEKGSPGYEARVIERQGVAALGVAGRDHAGQRAGVAWPTGCPGRARSRTPTRVSWPPPGAPAPAWATPAAYRRLLRYAQEAAPVRRAAGQLPDHPAAAGIDAGGPDRDAAVLPADRPPGRGGRLTPTVAGLAKMHNTRKARAITAEARDMLGGNGILLDYQVMRHMVGHGRRSPSRAPETMQTLIVGRAITGIGAFIGEDDLTCMTITTARCGQNPLFGAERTVVHSSCAGSPRRQVARGPRPQRLEYGGHRQPHDVSQSVRHTDQPGAAGLGRPRPAGRKGPSPSTRRSCGASA